jgi:hypothetical protein
MKRLTLKRLLYETIKSYFNLILKLLKTGLRPELLNWIFLTFFKYIKYGEGQQGG